MAEEIQIRGVGTTAKVRNPAGVLGLTLITFGIYGWFWWYTINREMADLGRARGTRELGDNPTLSLLAYVLGGFTFGIATVWTFVTTNQRIGRAQQVAVGEQTLNGWILALLIVGSILIIPAFFVPIYMQSELNKVWEAEGSGAAGGALPGGQYQQQAWGQPQAARAYPPPPGGEAQGGQQAGQYPPPPSGEGEQAQSGANYPPPAS